MANSGTGVRLKGIECIQQEEKKAVHSREAKFKFDIKSRQAKERERERERPPQAAHGYVHRYREWTPPAGGILKSAGVSLFRSMHGPVSLFYPEISLLVSQHGKMKCII